MTRSAPQALRASAALGGAADDADASGRRPQADSVPESGGFTIVKPKVSGTKLTTRIISGVVLGVAGFLAMLSGGLVWALWVCLGGFLSAKEYFTLTGNMTTELPHPPPKWASNVSVGLCGVFTLFVHLAGGKLTAVIMATLGAFGIVSFLLILQEDPHFSQFTATLFGIFYCGFLPAFWVKLRMLSASAVAMGSTGLGGNTLVSGWPALLGGPEVWTTGLVATLITVLCVVASDVGAYVFGKTLGRHQLIAISPNKTIEGAAGGLMCTLGTAFLMRYMLGWPAGVMETIGLGAVAFCASVFGDLVESVMKRNAGMKDSGSIIPGHGGFLDRFDSYMFTGVVVYFYIVNVMPHWFFGVVL
eukprot:CAMPEP_0197586282 /NCGR_PEP_ID=MMETSP1326-20131121/8295_1 /TAXON_ID=1155430 /ORGANISM="Genus nov. species nov., Strain RCC2288" /LENGTH=359 /DNA_ID=CAMNT_0043150883 /DNA_START=45 /DNA_END=1124 /DNA_ORIENTATION=+